LLIGLFGGKLIVVTILSSHFLESRNSFEWIFRAEIEVGGDKSRKLLTPW